MIKEQLIDYFKLFKIYDLKKLEKTGQVKIVQDKILMRKILSVEGTVSTENFTSFCCSNHANISFRQQYLYLLAFCEPGKSFTFQITYFLSNKQYRLICSTMYKEQFKRKSDSLFHYQLKMPTDKWTVLVLDLYSLINWDNSFKHDQDIRIGFRISNIEIRAHSKLRGMFQSETLFGPHNLPKDLQLPLRGDQEFFYKYAYFVTGLNMTEELKKQIQSYKQKTMSEEFVQNSRFNLPKKQIKPDNIKPSQKKNEGKSKSRQKVNQVKTSKDQSKQNLSKQKIQQKKQEKQTTRNPHIPNKKTKIQNYKKENKKSVQNHDQLNMNTYDDDLIQYQILQAPKPSASISLKLESIQALSVVNQNIISCGSFLIEPVLLPTHKKITNICKSRLGKVLTSYFDGSICLWDTIRKESLFYFKSQLQEIKCLLMDYEQNIIIVGLDRLKRQVIQIVSEQTIIFKQISTFNIKSIQFIAQQSFQMGLISYGFQNIRIWTISPNNNIINGYSVYLGKMARNITYNDCCVVQTVAGNYAFVCDSEGYVTKININQKKMEGVVKVDNSSIDHIKIIKYLNDQQKILVCNQKGIIKLLSCVTMECQLQYPINYRIKNIFLKQNPQSHDVPILLIQTYKKTLAELNLVDSTFHFNVRSHYQEISHIQYQKGNPNQSFSEDKIITAGSDSTVRIWKFVKVSDQQRVLKQEYEFLINGQTITHLCTTPRSKKGNQFVYMITDSLKIRKINTSSYQISKQISLPSSNKSVSNSVLSVSINEQGKYLIVVCENQMMLFSQQLQVIDIKDLNQNKVYKNKKSLKMTKYLSGFNTYKKSHFYMNPLSGMIEFYQIKDLQTPIFQIQNDQDEPFVSIEWNDNIIHCITDKQYQMYEANSLLRVIPLQKPDNYKKNHLSLNFITLNYPILCRSFKVQQTGDNFLQIQILNQNRLNETIKMPQKISTIKVTKPSQDKKNQSQNWQGQIICSGAQSYGLYVIKYQLINFGRNLQRFNDNSFTTQNHKETIVEYPQNQINSNINMETQNLSNISNIKRDNVLDISFSQSANLLLQPKSRFTLMNQNQSGQIINPPTQLKKLYEEEQKMFQQCKKAVFGNIFDDEHINNENIEEQTHQNKQMHPKQLNGNIQMKIFFGIQPKQSLLHQTPLDSKKNNQKQFNQLGQFYWNCQKRIISLFTNEYKTLLIYQFTEPQVTQRLLHLYTKPTSICWSPYFQGQANNHSSMNYFIVCNNSIIKLYNINNNLNFIRTIQCDLLIKDRHVIFNSFITNCNSFIVTLSLKLQPLQQGKIQKNKNKSIQNKLYIFVIDIATGKIVASSYRDTKHIQSSKARFNLQKAIQQTYSLQVNRFTVNKKLQFVLKGTNQLAFYRVTSMFTLQTLQLEEIYAITKQKTETMVSAVYAKIQNQVYLLVGTQNGALIIIDSRTGSIILVLLNLLSPSKGSVNSPAITYIQFIQQQNHSDSEVSETIPSKLVFFSDGSNSIRIITLSDGLNTLINQLQVQSTTIMENMSFSTHSINQQSINQNSRYCQINLDSEITSVSAINNTCQQLILTKSSTLWLVDYSDNCSIKIFSSHSERINQACLLPFQNFQDKMFISCSEDGYVKVTDIKKIEQSLQIYKPRKKASTIDVNGNYTLCGFKDQIYFYDVLTKQAKDIVYLGSIQFQNQIIIQVKNISLSDNYYVLTDKKMYIIFVKRKQITKNISKISVNSKLNKSQMDSSHISQSIKRQNTLEKVLIQIQIQEINNFNTNQSTNLKPLWIQINPFRAYDQFSIGFKGGKVQTWERKCLKRTLNPLQQLANVQQLQYYLIDVYSRKQILQPLIQFTYENQYMIALSELSKIQVRNYKEHSIINEIIFSEHSVDGIKSFKNLILPNQKTINQSTFDQTIPKGHSGLNYFNNINFLKKGPLILIGDQSGYLNICDFNGLVIQKIKIFSTPVQSINLQRQDKQNQISYNVLLKSYKYISLLQLKH